MVAFATSAKDGSDDYDIFEILAGEVDLDGNEPNIVKCILKFMYNMNYSDGRESDITTNIPRPANISNIS